MAMVEIDGHRVAYERVGAGPPLLLLHGYVGDGASTWWPQLDALSGRLHRRRVGCAGGGPIIGSSWTLRDGGIRRLPRPLRRPPRIGRTACGRPVLRRCTGDRILSPTIPRSLPPDARRRLRRLGRLASAGDRGTASPSGARAVRAVARRARRPVVTDMSSAGARPRPSMSCGPALLTFTPLASGPWRVRGRRLAGGAAAHRRSDAPGLWQRRHPGAGGRCRSSAPGHPGLGPGPVAGRWSRLQPGSPRRGQRRTIRESLCPRAGVGPLTTRRRGCSGVPARARRPGRRG